nr:immunoglobulin heavy chain junction region [Macaca mulatta]MPN77975.1 immunoglobulin heavy chain junction region [Macaca mulatta]
CYNEGDFW